MYDFKVSKIKKEYSNTIEKENKVNEYLATFEVLDSTATSYTIKWKYQLNLAQSYDLSGDMKESLSKYEFSEVIYTTSETGAFVEIINWKDVRDLMNNVFDDIFDKAAKRLTPEIKTQMETMFSSVRQSYSTKDGIEQIVFKELQYFHYLMGLEYSVSEPLLFDDALPNMFGGDPIKGKAKLYVSEIKPEDNFVVMKHEMKLDEKDTKNLLLQVFSKMGLDSKDVKKMIKKSQFDVTDNNRFEFFYFPCIPLKIETNRETILIMEGVNTKRIDQTIIELITYEEGEE